MSRRRTISRRRTVLGLGLGLALAVSLAAGAAPAEKIRNHFDSDTPLRVPGYFDLEDWGAPGPAAWKVIADFNPPSAPNKLAQTSAVRPADSLAVALRRTYAFSDGKVSVGLQKGSGLAGLVLRAAGAKDHLLLLVDVGTGEAVLTSVRGGKPTELARGKASLEQEWGTLSVDASGPTIEARWNGAPLLKGIDPKPASGRFGPATRGPGSVSFDELVFEVAPATR